MKMNLNESVSFLSGGEGIQEGEGERASPHRQGRRRRQRRVKKEMIRKCEVQSHERKKMHKKKEKIERNLKL